MSGVLFSRSIEAAFSAFAFIIKATTVPKRPIHWQYWENRLIHSNYPLLHMTGQIKRVPAGTIRPSIVL
tara:strand:+ start:696 stop:902 length:207 start_codon:yes stop_codon:yes gene_type:complete